MPRAFAAITFTDSVKAADASSSKSQRLRGFMP